MTQAAAVEAGCYDASRASALSGVPLSTLYEWARSELVVPSISPSREMLWSYADLMTLRLVSWLRRPKRPAGEVRASPMSRVRAALAFMAARDVDPWATGTTPSLWVDARGAIVVQDGSEYVDLHGQVLLDLPEESLELLRPFALMSQPGGPDLVRPRPSLRILPTKVAGEPHVADTRITSRTLAALVGRGIATSTIAGWYGVPPAAVVEAADLEEQLTASLAAA